MTALQAASSRQRDTRLLALRAVREARTVQTRGIAQLALTVVTHQVTAASSADRAITAMLQEQGLSTIPAAAATLNSLAFTTNASTLEQMLVSAGPAGFDRLIASLVQDAARTAENVAVAVRPQVGMVRYLSLPSCARCAVLANRVYKYSEGFLRHPNCDCVMIPVAESSPDMTQDPVDLMRRGLIRGLSQADMDAINAGADFNQVVNVRRTAAGLRQSGRVLARRGRLTPEGIFQLASTWEQVLELLLRFGYIR